MSQFLGPKIYLNKNNFLTKLGIESWNWSYTESSFVNVCQWFVHKKSANQTWEKTENVHGPELMMIKCPHFLFYVAQSINSINQYLLGFCEHI